ncbi:MAG TPA: type I polyketide synthase [Pyrinomonadaceae bacterium]|jgi:acyl transferase domain-containing protein
MSGAGGDEQWTGSEVAVVGMAGRFPAAANVEDFWRNLRDGLDAVSRLTPDEVEALGLSPEALRGGNYVNAAYVLEGVETFDAAFFGINPREAEILDPQHRLFLECAWEALEHAGYDPERYEGAVGVYGGAKLSTYLFNLYAEGGTLAALSRVQIVMANDKDHLTTRVSYKLNLRGPSVNVQTTCSTSLVAVHLACQSLLNGECDMALAGGVAVTVPQKTGYFYQEGNINSPDGSCRAFDADAMGTVGGNGVGIVVLKRLADALADGDCVHALVRGSAVNNDGSLKVGYTAPSVEGQAKVIAEALAIAEVEPDTISYVEAHGTGTTLGDPIEIAALTKAFRAGTERKGFCAIGSVKTNVGHLDTAAGVAGLIKTVLALKHGELPPSLHFKRPNPKIDFDATPFVVNHTLRAWEANGSPRRAGVSSFGIGGTNAHVVVEEAPDPEPSGASRPWQLFTLSARSAAALDAATENLAEHLRRNPEQNLADAAYTLHVGRKAFGHRRALVCRDAAGAVAALAGTDPGRVFTGPELRGGARPVAFMFSGQGAQHVGMGAGLYESEETFRAEIDRCAELLRPHLGADLRDTLYPRPEGRAAAEGRINQTAYTQPALFAVEYALARQWMAWGLRPQAFIGHSIGEYVAACLSGVMSLEDALSLVAARGRLMQQLPAGVMLAVPLAEAEVEELLGPGLSLAAVNGPRTCVASGAEEAVGRLEESLRARGVEGRRLHTSHAFHSEMMEPILGRFTEVVRSVSLRPPRVPYVSNVTGAWVTAEEATDPTYWARHLRRTVRFAEGVGLLLGEGERVLLEVGPGRTLGTLAQARAGDSPAAVLDTLPRPGAKASDVEHVLQTLGRLWASGVEVDWKGFHAGERRARVPLPTYPFERRRFWVGRPALGAAPRPRAEGRQAAANGASGNGAAVVNTAQAPLGTPEQAAEPVQTQAPRVDGEARVELVARQLALMSQQLELLRRRRAGD